MGSQELRILKRFKHFADHGITEEEIYAAVKILKRELGYNPQIFQVAEYVEDHIQWRLLHRRYRNGELKINYEYTNKGKQIKEIEDKVNKIFKKKGGE